MFAQELIVNSKQKSNDIFGMGSVVYLRSCDMRNVPAIVALAAIVCWTLVMAPKSVTFRQHDHLVSVLFGDLLSHSYNITFSMFLHVSCNCSF